MSTSIIPFKFMLCFYTQGIFFMSVLSVHLHKMKIAGRRQIVEIFCENKRDGPQQEKKTKQRKQISPKQKKNWSLECSERKAILFPFSSKFSKFHLKCFGHPHSEDPMN